MVIKSFDFQEFCEKLIGATPEELEEGKASRVVTRDALKNFLGELSYEWDDEENYAFCYFGDELSNTDTVGKRADVVAPDMMILPDAYEYDYVAFGTRREEENNPSIVPYILDDNNVMIYAESVDVMFVPHESTVVFRFNDCVNGNIGWHTILLEYSAPCPNCARG